MSFYRKHPILLIFLTILWLLIISVGFLIGFPGSKFVPVAIHSGSMEPTILTNAFCIVYKCDIDEIEEGDIVLFYSPDYHEKVTHRVIEKGPDYLVTRGDANNINDPTPIVDNNFFTGKVIITCNWLAPIVTPLMSDNQFNKAAAIAMIFIFFLQAVFYFFIIKWAFEWVWAFVMVVTGHAYTRSIADQIQHAHDVSSDLYALAEVMNRTPNESLHFLRAKSRVYNTLSVYLRVMEEIEHSLKKVD